MKFYSTFQLHYRHHCRNGDISFPFFIFPSPLLPLSLLHAAQPFSIPNKKISDFFGNCEKKCNFAVEKGIKTIKLKNMGFFKALFGGKVESPEEKAESSKQSDFELFKYDGKKAIRIAQYDYAVKCLERALEINGDDLETREYLSQALVQTNRIPEAIEQLKVLAAAQPDNIQIPLRIARVAYLEADYDTMEEATAKVLELNPDDTQALFYAAQADNGQGKPQEAIEKLNKVISIEHEAGEAYLLRGQITLKNGDPEKADEDAQWLAQHTSDNEDVLMLQADIETARQHPDYALAYLNQILELNPFNAEALRRRGNIRQQQGDTQGAEEDLAQANEINPLADTENIEAKVNQAYKDINPFGI